jgi:1-deoxy-D-xylulose-5-phosphate reductoisomerase
MLEQKQGICILGSTGSIGCNTLDVIKRNFKRYEVLVLTANLNVNKMLEQCLEFKPKVAIMADQVSAKKLSELLTEKNSKTIVKSGRNALIDAASFDGVTTVVAAIVGGSGLLPTLTAVSNGLKVLLANKEALVMSGEVFTDVAKKNGAILLPVDSEHNAIFQCLPEIDSNAQSSLNGVSKILLTGSGGPFRTRPLEDLFSVTPEQACAHPNWEMGRKISVDSATMMNKGLELIEACFLFGLSLEQIEIVVHPQSIVHSMVSYKDGSVLAQMGNPDMRTPIAHTLAWPQRIDAGVKPLDFYSMTNLTFEAPDYERFPCLRLATEALKAGGTSPCILNAANEIAVDAFLNLKIRFTDIAWVIEETMKSFESSSAETLSEILAIDSQARAIATEVISNLEKESEKEKVSH